MTRGWTVLVASDGSDSARAAVSLTRTFPWSDGTRVVGVVAGAPPGVFGGGPSCGAFSRRRSRTKPDASRPPWNGISPMPASTSCARRPSRRFSRPARPRRSPHRRRIAGAGLARPVLARQRQPPPRARCVLSGAHRQGPGAGAAALSRRRRRIAGLARGGPVPDRATSIRPRARGAAAGGRPGEHGRTDGERTRGRDCPAVGCGAVSSASGRCARVTHVRSRRPGWRPSTPRRAPLSARARHRNGTCIAARWAIVPSVASTRPQDVEEGKGSWLTAIFENRSRRERPT